MATSLTSFAVKHTSSESSSSSSTSDSSSFSSFKQSSHSSSLSHSGPSQDSSTGASGVSSQESMIAAISESDSSVIFCLPHFSSKLSSATSLLAASISSSETGVLNSSLSSNLSKSPSSVRLSLTSHEAMIESISDSTLSLRADFSDFSSTLFSSAAGSTISKPCSFAVLVSLFFSIIFSHSSLVPAKTSFSGLSDRTTLHSSVSSV